MLQVTEFVPDHRDQLLLIERKQQRYAEPQHLGPPETHHAHAGVPLQTDGDNVGLWRARTVRDSLDQRMHRRRILRAQFPAADHPAAPAAQPRPQHHHQYDPQQDRR
jgi:hypothetical protein